MLHNKYFDIIKEFLKGYFGNIYGRELINCVSLSPKNIALTLNELEKEGILKSIKSGNRKHYSFNFDNVLLVDHIITFESLRKINFLEKNRKFIDLFNELDAKIVCVFGSYAKEKNVSNSDLDLFVVGKIDQLKVKKIGKKYGIEIQVFNLSMKDFIKYIREKSRLFVEVLNNHVLVKGGDIFVKEVLKWSN